MRSIIVTGVVLVLGTFGANSARVVGADVAAPTGKGAPQSDGPYFGDGNLPPGCTNEFTGSVFTPRFEDDCFHMRVDLNNLDSTKVNVLLVPPVSPYPERDLRVMRQSIEMWEAGIKYLAPRMGLEWLAEGVEFAIFVDHPEDEVDTDPLWSPKVVVVSTNPAGGVGIGIDPLYTLFGAEGPCHGVPNPLGSFADWKRLPGFDSHHDGRSGTFTAECQNGGSVCFAVNGAIDPAPGLLRLFDLYDLVSHEIGHCLSVGHVGDAFDHTAQAAPRADIMSYTPQDHMKCVSTLDVEGFALRMSEFLLDAPLEANDTSGDAWGTFQVQHPADHSYASSSGLPEDCPQPDLDLVPGERRSFTPTDGD